MVVKGPKLSGNISGTDPLKDNRLLLQAEALDGTDEARHTAKVVNELSKEISRILVAHPLNAKRAVEGKNIANLVLLRGCGIRIEVCCLKPYLIYSRKYNLEPKRNVGLTRPQPLCLHLCLYFFISKSHMSGSSL